MDPEELRMARLLKAMKVNGHKTKVDLPMYGGKLYGEEILDWIGALDNHFECEDVEEDQKVKVEKSKMKGHSLLWWNFVQTKRRKKRKSKITS